MHQLEPFGVRLHQAVLDAVVNHLDVVAGAVVADAQIAVFGCEREKDRLEPPAHRQLAADHETKSLGETPDAAARSSVNVVNLFRRQFLSATNIIVKVRVPAVDHDIVWPQTLPKRRDDRFSGFTSRHHDPHSARRLETADETFECRDTTGSSCFGPPDGLLAGPRLPSGGTTRCSTTMS